MSVVWKHWHIFIYKAIIGRLPGYLNHLFNRITSSYNLRSQNLVLFNVPRASTEFGKSAFSYYAPWSWNQLQKDAKLDCLIPLDGFKSLLQSLKTEVCSCFTWRLYIVNCVFACIHCNCICAFVLYCCNFCLLLFLARAPL